MKNQYLLFGTVLLSIITLTAAPTNMRQYRAQEQFYIFAYGYGLSPHPNKQVTWSGWSREDVVSLMVPELFSTTRQEFTMNAHVLGYAEYLSKKASWVEELQSGSVLIKSDYEDTKISFKDGAITAVETICKDGMVTSHINYQDGKVTELSFSWDGACESMKSTPVYKVFYDYETGQMNKVEKRVNGILDYWSCYTYSGDKLVTTVAYRKGQPFYSDKNYFTGDRLDSSYTINEYDDTTVTRFQYNRKGFLCNYSYGDLSGESVKKVHYQWKGNRILSYSYDTYYKGREQQKTRTEFTYVNGRLTQELWVVQDGDQFEILPTHFTYENDNLVRTAKHIALDVTYETITVGDRMVTVPVTAIEQGQDFEFEWTVE